MTHRSTLAMFRKEVSERQPKLIIDTGLMSLNGRIDHFHDFMFS